MQRHYNVLEEDDVLVSERHRKARDDARQDVEQLGCAVEAVVFVDEQEEALVHGLADHLPARNQLGVQLVQDVFEVVALHGLFRVEQFEELLHELRRHIALEGLHINRFVDDELQEQVVDALQVRPRRVYFVFLVDAGLGHLQIGLLEARQRSEQVLLDHDHDLVEVRHDQLTHELLALEHAANFVDSVDALCFTLSVTLLVAVVKLLFAYF